MKTGDAVKVTKGPYKDYTGYIQSQPQTQVYNVRLLAKPGGTEIVPIDIILNHTTIAAIEE